MSKKEMKQEKQTAFHNIEPVYDENSRILILGSFPSVKSREGQFFYHHPQNRFWKILSALTGDEFLTDIEGKRELLLKNRIAVWDVIGSCKIHGSSDSSIEDVVPNDINRILETAPIEHIFTNGGKSYEMYRRYLLPLTKKEAVKLPSSSPANASWSLERLIEAWKIILE
ncbi:MAG: DNA-deoxyinosine glycosylase [Lachnospiraceae bacterium]|nr:DNA-deoxyinosine glycosylase [Lachnospiraceae bacterium]